VSAAARVILSALLCLVCLSGICAKALTDARIEDYEGRLVKVNLAKIVRRFTPLPTAGFHIQDMATATDTIFVENFNQVLGAGPYRGPGPDSSSLGHLVTVTGVLHYSSGSFRIVPRSVADVVDNGLASVGPSTGQLSFSVYPNPSRTAKFSFSLAQDEDVEIGMKRRLVALPLAVVASAMEYRAPRQC